MADTHEAVDDQSPVQQYLEIHRCRLATVLERMLQKIEITYCLEPLFANECQRIAEFLPRSELDVILELNTKMNKSISMGISSSSKSSRIKSNKFKKSTSMVHLHQDLTCSNLISTLHHSEDIMKEVHIILDAKPQSEIQFLIKMRELKEHIANMLGVSAAEERAYNKMIGKAWTNNEKYKGKNAEMQKIHNNKIYELSFKVEEKKAIIQKYMDQMDDSKEKCMNDLHKIINNSELRMTRHASASESNQELLEEEAKYATNQYQTLLEAHLAHEKALRIKRYKVETVLAGWLTKYDTEIGDLQAQLEEQEDGYNQEKADFDNLTLRYTEQTIEFDTLMEEKRIEEQRLFDIKLFAFMQFRSARRVQRWWRAILARWYSRRKGKGKGKKKK